MLKQQKVLRQYRLMLQIGPPEAMGKNGEMGSGKQAMCSMPGMSMSGSMGMKPCNHHVELHVLEAHTNKPVMGAHVSITMRDTQRRMTITVPIMTMGMGSDYHYGNNVYAAPGTYTVIVPASGLRTRFTPVRLR